MDSPVVQVIEVSKSFRTTRAVDGISLEVKNEEILALLGPNGAGKSTLVRMMIGMILPDQGVIQWYDKSGNPSPIDISAIGYLPEERGLYADQNVSRILEYFGQLHGLTKLQARQSAQEWAEKLDIAKYLPSKLSTLSKGNQQKVQIAATVLHRPMIVFLDEPFSGLDPINQEMMVDVIRSLRSQGTTIVLSGHQLELLERMADRLLLLHHGKRVLSGTIPEIKSSSYSGYALRIRFAKPISRTLLESWKDDPELLAVNLMQENYLEIVLKRPTDKLRWLERAFELAEVIDFRGGYLSLREIYLRAIPSNDRQLQYPSDSFGSSDGVTANNL
jgi:ABC-2 type transport system ATP-binding protein